MTAVQTDKGRLVGGSVRVLNHLAILVSLSVHLRSRDIFASEVLAPTPPSIPTGLSPSARRSGRGRHAVVLTCILIHQRRSLSSRLVYRPDYRVTDSVTTGDRLSPEWIEMPQTHQLRNILKLVRQLT